MPPDQSQGASSVDSGGDLPDFNELYEQAREEIGSTRGELEQTRAELDQVRGESQASRATLSRLQKALSGDDEKGAAKIDRIPGLRAQLDEYLQAALDAERGGRPIPLTTNMAVQFFEHAIAYEGEREKTSRELADLRKRVERASDPQESLANNAYVDIDGKIITALNTVYGTGPELNDVKTSQFKAIANLVADELQGLRKSDPAAFDQVLRQPNARAALVRTYVERVIPPRARQIMQEDAINREESTVESLLQALREAREALPDNPELRPIIDDIKTELVEAWWMRNKGKGVLNRAMRA